MNEIYLNKIILSYNDICNLLNELCTNKNYKKRLRKELITFYTTFKYQINSYTLGNGKKHVVIFSNTHGCEIITSLFSLEFILTLILDDKLYNYFSKEYTFHFICILNPEGFIISSSQVYYNLKDLNNNEIEEFSKLYLEAYNLDDKIAMKNFKQEKLYKSVLKTSCDLINNNKMKQSINNILKNCNLNSTILPVWSANSMGIDPNSNSIHKFYEIVNLRKIWCYSKLRYNDIPVTIPSPMSYPGKKVFDKCCPENIFLYKYLTGLYFNLPIYDSKLIAVFSFHSTGGEIYGYPDKNITSSKNISLHKKAVNIYSNITGYTPINEDLKYGVMDFYRSYLENTVSLTIELSKLNGNPIGPLANIDNLFNEFIKNKKAIFDVITNI